MAKKEKTFAIKSVSRTADILSCIGEGINSVNGIAERCKLSKSTVYRLLKALMEAQLIIYSPLSRTYFVGDVITKIASNQQIAHDYLIDCSLEEMKQLSEITEETVNLSTMIGTKYSSLYAIHSKKDLRVVVETGNTDVVNSGAAGKVMLAQLNSSDLKIAMKNIKLERITEFSVVDKEELIFQLKRTRLDGYNVCANEKVVGSMGIAAPIKNYTQPVALSIIGPEVRMKPRVKEMTEALLASAARISDNIKNNRQ